MVDGGMRLSDAYELLLACCRIDRGTSHGQMRTAARLEAGVDWQEVLRLAHWHRLGPALYHYLRSTGLLPTVPEEPLAVLAADYFENGARSLYLGAERDAVVGALAAAGVDCVLLKGAALVELVYDDSAVRPMHDLDILVPKPDLQRAYDTVCGLGYLPADADARVHHRGPHHAPPLISPTQLLAVELHHHVVSDRSPLNFDIATVWDRARPVAMDGATCLIPSGADLLVHLSVHFLVNRLGHSKGAMGQVWDIAETTVRGCDARDWDVLTDDLRLRHLGPAMALALQSAGLLLGTETPPATLFTLGRGATPPSQVEDFVRRRVLRSGPWLSIEQLTSERRPLRHLLTSASAPAAGRGRLGLAGMSAAFVGRLARACQLAAGAILRPNEARRDFAMNRWLRGLPERRATPSGTTAPAPGVQP